MAILQIGKHAQYLIQQIRERYSRFTRDTKILRYEYTSDEEVQEVVNHGNPDSKLNRLNWIDGFDEGKLDVMAE